MDVNEYLRLKLLGLKDEEAGADRAPAGTSYQELKAASGAPNASVKEVLDNFAKSTSATTKTRTGYKIPTSEEYASLTALAPEFENLNSYLYNQEQERKELKKKAEEFYSKPPETNYAPWLALLDKWGGTNFASGYTQPKTAREQEEAGLKTQAALLKEGNSATSEAGRMARMLGQTGDIEVIKQLMEKFTKDSETTTAGDQKPIGARGGPKPVDPSKLIATEQYKKAAAYASFLDAYDDFSNTFDKHGYGLVGEGRALLQTKRKNLDLKVKEAEKLGSLQAGEIKLIDDLLSNVSSISPTKMAEYQLKGGKEGIKSAIKSLREQFTNTGKAYVEDLKIGFPTLKNEVSSLENRFHERAGKELTPRDQQALEWAKANPKDARAKKIMEKLGAD